MSSAASSVTAADAAAVLTALLGEPDLVAAVEQAEPEPDPGFFAAPLFLPPAEAKPARRRRAAKPVAEPAGGEAAAVDGSAGQPVAAEPAAAEESKEPAEPETAETGTSRSGRRRRGRSGARSRGDQGADEGDNPRVPEPAAEVESAADGEAVEEQVAAVAGAEPDDDDGDLSATRRRRRGRRGRGRAGDDRSEENTESPQQDADGGSAITPVAEDESGDAAQDEVGDETADDTDDDAGTRRRRRRRRRTGTAEAGTGEAGREDDPDNTVVHVREPRPAGSAGQVSTTSSSSEVQGVRGSTRLEAKRQRRRDGRGSRSRPQILTEAEFLARREAVDRVMAVRQRGDLAQVALLEDGILVEHFVSLAGSESLMGNIYLGRVQNVLPSMEAAFVDIGKGRNAVLYAGEVNWDAAGLAGKARRIETALSGGDTLLVQVSKDPVGQKGARLTTQISLPGRFLVYVPGGGATGISRKLPDTERKRLKAILDRIVPEDAGVIIRTAAEGVAEEELARDVERLKSQWEQISRQAEKKSNAPLQLSAEPDTLIKVVRDLFNSDISSLVLDGDQAYEPVAAYINAVAPELADRVSRYDGPNDVFAAYRIDEQIAKALERKVYLPSGGSLVIDRTEAMTVIDVNTGKYTGSGGNLEETVTKNNLEAAEEVVRQLRLRDIGGIIVVDFIDMVLEANRELVMRRLTECLGRDRTRHQVAEVTSLGLIQMTRKKMGTGLVEAFSQPCPHCHGRGILLHDAPMEDRSGAQDFGDSDGRAPRGRRGKGRQDLPTAETEPVKIVPATVRPPDPRGPKPPRVSADGHDGHADHETGSAGHDVTEVVAVRSDASLNAPRSRDASDAVSAVLAALDAQTQQRADAEVEPAAVPDDDIETAAPTGRRRGRRAAGRPAGAPSSPTVDPAGDAPTESAPAEAPEQVTAQPVVELTPAPTETATDPAPIQEAETGRRGRAQPRRRGSRAAGATAAAEAAVAQASPPANGHAGQDDGQPSGQDGAHPSAAANGASAPVSGSEAAPSAERAAAVKTAPARRRRAASRPAGPAGVPAPVGQN